MEIKRDNRVDALNVLRVIATISVFFLHTTIFEPEIAGLFQLNGFSFLWRTPAWSSVWIFLILGGYLAGKGFAVGRYTFTRKSILRYYSGRLTKVILPTFAFIFMCIVLCFPGFIIENPQVLLKFVTFTYQATPGVSGVSATWYVFTIFWFYLFTPPVAWILDKLRNRKTLLWLLLVALSGATLAWRIYAKNAQLEWNAHVYCPPLANMDLYIGGMIFAYLNAGAKAQLPGRLNRSELKWIAGILFAVLFFINCYHYNAAHFGEPTGVAFSMYYYQTIYLVVCLVYIGAFDYERLPNARVSLKTMRENPLRIIDAFSAIGLEFYLFHSLVLDRVSPYVLQGRTISWGLHFQLIIIAAVITMILSAGFHRIFADISKKRNYRSVSIEIWEDCRSSLNKSIRIIGGKRLCNSSSSVSSAPAIPLCPHRSTIFSSGLIRSSILLETLWAGW